MRPPVAWAFRRASVLSVLLSIAFPATASEEWHTGTANPAAVYCQELGYEHRVVDSDGGERGLCIFPDGTSCDAWTFLRGTCRPDLSFCARLGLGLTVRNDGRDPFSSEYAVCVDPDGRDAGSVTELMDLGGIAALGDGPVSSDLHDEPPVPPIHRSLRYPLTFDWRDHGGADWMTPVKNQGGCGSCWAFGSIGTMEAMHNIASGNPDLDLDLSEEYLVSSCYANLSCCGGWYTVMDFLRDSGVPDETCMPYVSGSNCPCTPGCPNCEHPSHCSNSACSDRCDDWEYRLARIDTVSRVYDASPARYYISEEGPLAVSMGVGSECGGYWDGDIYRCEDGDCQNHSVVLVGYDTPGGYWIVKNSWGTGFGEGGYFKLGYGECGVTNQCGAGVGVDWVGATDGPLGDSAEGAGAAWGDYDNDGDLDIYLANADGPDRLFSNEGPAGFVDATAAPLGHPGASAGVAWGDCDNDGDLDLYVADSAGPNRLYMNDGGTFVDATAAPVTEPEFASGVAWGDYDADGGLDLYVVGHGENRLFRNTGGGSFEDVTSPPLGGGDAGEGAAWGDYDDDGDLDLYVANDTASNRLFANEGNGSFSDVTEPPVDDANASTGAAWGDCDNDGDLDLYVTNADAPNRLFLNAGGSFSDAAAGALAHPGDSRGATWGDFDNDGDLDLYVVNAGEPNLLFTNLGQGSFVLDAHRGARDPGDARSVAWGDHDDDGDLDLYVANAAGENNVLLSNQSAAANHWLRVAPQGDASNRAGIGARVRVVDERGAQIREISGGSGSLGQNASVAHFGLGSVALVETIEVRWPNGLRSVRYNVDADRLVTIPENLAPAPPRDLTVVPGEGSAELAWTAEPETDFSHFEIERDTTGSFGGGTATIVCDEAQYLDAPLPADEYFYRVSAVDSARNRSAPSGIAACVPESNPPPAPTSFVAEVMESMVTLSWGTPPVPDVEIFRIERDTTSLFDTARLFTSPDTVYVDLQVVNERAYFYRVLAIDVDGLESAPSDTLFCLPPNFPPSAPSEVFTKCEGGHVALAWNENEELDIDGYVVYRARFPDLASPESLAYVASPPFVDSTCEELTVYWYSARTRDDLGVLSAPSDAMGGVAVSGGTVYVDGDFVGVELGTYGHPFDELGEGLEAARAGDAVLVLPTTYDGAIALKDSVAIVGMLGPSQTRVLGSLSALSLGASTVLAGFDVDGLGITSAALECVDSDVIVEACVFRNAAVGAAVSGSGSATLRGNTFISNQMGVTCAGSAAPVLSGNTFADNTFTHLSSDGDPGPLIGGELAAANDFLGGAFLKIHNTGAAEIAARYNYWNDLCVDPSWFTGAVDYVPWTDETHTQVHYDCPTGTQQNTLPLTFALSRSYPNPGGPATRIAYDVPRPGGHVRLSVHNASGRLVRVLVDRDVSPGRHVASWDATDGLGRPVSSGVYFCRLEAVGAREERKLVLIR